MKKEILKKELVSVVIPTYNSQDYIVETIESILHQTYKEIEIIVIDDGSKDDTRKKLKKYIEEKKIKYIYQNNKGVSSARNRGIMECNGEYISFVDSDDIWYEYKIDEQINYLKKNPTKIMVIGDCDVVNEKLEFQYYHRNKFQGSKNQKIKQIFYGKVSMVTPTILFKKELIKEIPGFNEELTHREDNFFLMQVLKKYDIGVINRPLYKRRERQDSLSQSKDFIKLITAHEKFIKLVIENFKYLNIKKEYSRLYYGIAVNCIKEKKEIQNYLVKSISYNIFNYKSYIYLILNQFFTKSNIKSFFRGVKK